MAVQLWHVNMQQALATQLVLLKQCHLSMLHVAQSIRPSSCCMLTDASLQVVCDFCEKHLEANKQAFADPRLHLIIDDARAQLEKAEGPFDVIIGDLADPVFGGPCYQVQPPDIPLASLLVPSTAMLLAMQTDTLCSR